MVRSPSGHGVGARVGEALHSGAKGQVLLLPELASSSGGNQSRLQEQSILAHEEDQQVKMSPSLKDDRKLKAFRQSAHSSQKVNNSRKLTDKKETIHVDCSALIDNSGKV